MKNKITNYRIYHSYDLFTDSNNSNDIKAKICAFLCADVYKMRKTGESIYYTDSNCILTKWTIVESVWNAHNTGFDSYIYFNRESSQFIIAFRGTEPDLFKRDNKDIKADFEMLREKTMFQYVVAYNFVRNFIKTKLEAGTIYDYKFNSKLAIQNLIFTGHSLGGSIAQLLGAQEEFLNINVLTFNPLGMAEYLYRYNVKLKQALKKSNQSLTINEFREIYSKDVKHPYKFSHTDKSEFTNITNYIVTRDPVSAIYDQIGVNKIVKVSKNNRINFRDIILLTPMLKKICKGHDSENFINDGALEIVNSPFTYQSLIKPLRVFQGDKITKRIVAPILNLFAEKFF